jgi:hypothetical protein
MHKHTFHVVSNTFLLLLLLSVLVLPFSTIGIAKYVNSPQVLSSQQKRPTLQLPEEKVLSIERTPRYDQYEEEFEEPIPSVTPVIFE